MAEESRLQFYERMCADRVDTLYSRYSKALEELQQVPDGNTRLFRVDNGTIESFDELLARFRESNVPINQTRLRNIDRVLSQEEHIRNTPELAAFYESTIGELGRLRAIGRWFTNTLAEATFYLRYGIADGETRMQISYIDVPLDVARAHLIANARDDVILPEAASSRAIRDLKSARTVSLRHDLEFFMPEEIALTRRPFLSMTAKEINSYTAKEMTGAGERIDLMREEPQRSASYRIFSAEEMAGKFTAAQARSQQDTLTR